MTKAVRIVIGDLPDAPLAAAARFHAEHASGLLAQAKSVDVTAIIFPPADHGHALWRKAAVQELARAAAPSRVNAIVGTHEAGLAQTAQWLEQAHGVTGHVLTIEDAA